eukprot:Lankesteria_metandrocarpae@DN10483_c0_g1_i1.p1
MESDSDSSSKEDGVPLASLIGVNDNACHEEGINAVPDPLSPLSDASLSFSHRDLVLASKAETGSFVKSEVVGIQDGGASPTVDGQQNASPVVCTVVSDDDVSAALAIASGRGVSTTADVSTPDTLSKAVESSGGASQNPVIEVKGYLEIVDIKGGQNHDLQWLFTKRSNSQSKELLSSVLGHSPGSAVDGSGRLLDPNESVRDSALR